MLKDVVVPEVAENVTEGQVIDLLVAVGDVVEHDQSLLELETDKAVVAIPAPFAGTVAEILVAVGDTIAVGTAIMRLETETRVEPSSGATAGRQKAAERKQAPPPGRKGQPGPPSESTVRARAESAAAGPPTETAPSPGAGDEDPPPASPAVRRLARELGVDIRAVRGTGTGGRISEDDLRAHVREQMAGGSGLSSGSPGRTAPRAPAPGGRRVAAGARGTVRAPAGSQARGSEDADLTTAAPLPDFSRWGAVRIEELSTVREITANTMARAWATIPQVTQYERADITELERFRGEYASDRAQDEAKLTMTAILLKICGAALREFPRLNSSLDWPRRQLVLKEYVAIGVAVDTDRGLLVPVVRDADRKGVTDLAAELDDLAERARSKRIRPDELEGGNFTISNLGGIGGTAFSPIVYPPQVAILGVARAGTEAVWRDGAFVPRLQLPLALTYDHRVIDGADGARFLRWICRALEQPLMLAMKGPF